MKNRVYKQVIELGHYIPNFGEYQDKWVVDSVIEDAERVLEYIEEIEKETAIFCGGVYVLDGVNMFRVRFRLIGTREIT